MRETLVANAIETGESGKAIASGSGDYEESFVEKDTLLGEGSGHDDDDSLPEYPLSDVSDSDEDEDNENSPSRYPITDSSDSEDEVNEDGEQRADEDEVMEDQ